MVDKIKGICQGGKSYLIEPNKLFGHDENDNFFVPPEDLNIYVELSTSKKNRSVIDMTGTELIGVSSEKGKSKVSFIGGTDIGGTDSSGKPKTSLTTSYTELTTVFNKTADTEKFGISSIDIEFNSAYAPLIKIEFIDIRGASLFNTGNPPKSEYSSFFDLPYPIFELKIKGYYGKTVKYCLHLTKWNARFNSKTGNFEITADFIGYTYAMLTDMLLGYLRAITKTDAGRVKFDAAKAEMKNPNELITINELLNKIQDVNEGITQLEQEDEDIVDLDATKKLKDNIEGLDDIVNNVITKIKEPTAADTDGYAIFSSTITNGLFGVHHTPADATQNKKDLINFVDTMTTKINNINLLLPDSDKLKVVDYTNVRSYEYFRYNAVYSSTTTTTTTAFRDSWTLKGDAEFDDFKKNFNHLTNPQRWLNIDLFDFSTIKANIKNLKERVNTKEEKIKEDIGLKIQGTVKDLLGFEPTIKNIFRIFTVHAEIFMECIKDTSKLAQDDKDGKRMAEFDKLKDKVFDIKRSDSTNTGTLPSTIYPWPLYRKENTKHNKGGALEEAWLGADVDIPQNVPELVFVEELLKGLLLISKEDAERQAAIDNPGITIDSWYPINPLDTPLFGVTQNPYKTNTIGNTSNPVDPLLLMMERAFIFIGVSNRQLHESELIAMATLEANTANIGISDNDIKLAMLDLGSSGNNVDDASSIIINTFLNGEDKSGRKVSTLVDGQPRTTGRPFMFKATKNSIDYYYYKYISGGGSGDQKFIPLNGDLHGSEFFDDDDKFLSSSQIKKTKLSAEAGGGNLLFISPPRTNSGRVGNYGPTFVKIITEDFYNNSESLQPRYETQDIILQTVINDVKSREPGNLDYGTLYSVDRTDDAEDPIGFNIFGNNVTDKFAFTTIDAINYVNIDTAAAEREIFPGGETNGTSKAAFYVNMAYLGATSLGRKTQDVRFIDSWGGKKGKLSNYEISTKAEFKLTPAYGVGAGVEETYYPVRNHGGSRILRKLSDNSVDKTNRPAHTDIGKNRELFIAEGDTMIPHIDFAVQSSGTLTNTNTIYSLFGSQLYFEQRRSSSPKSARAFLFLHTFPWNSLFTDDVDYTHTDGTNAAIFNNLEGHVLSNIFGRKAAFVHAPRLWCAFIGGHIWRAMAKNSNTPNDIVWEEDKSKFKDNSGMVPTYKGGSGKYDPIVFGKRVNTNMKSPFSDTYVPQIPDTKGSASLGNTPYATFPSRSEYLTHDSAKGPLHFSPDGDYKKSSTMLNNLPIQIKEEFMKIFFDFVNSPQWETIRKSYEIFPNKRNTDGTLDSNPDLNWDYPDVGAAAFIVYGTNGYAGAAASWDYGSDKWTNRWWWASRIPTANESGQNILAVNAKGGTPINYGTEKGVKGIKVSYVKKTFPNYAEFEYIQPIRFSGSLQSWKLDITPNAVFNWDIGYRGTTDTNIIVTKLFTEGIWIANASYKPWVDHETKAFKSFDNTIAVQVTILEKYVKAFVIEFNRITKIDTIKEDENKLLQQVFNTMDSDVIRLNIYRHCKTIYDKWIAGSPGNILTSCGTPNKSVDKATASKDRISGEHRLIDSFRFVNRAFNDLGDDYLLNPKIITDILVGNLNQSFYDLISRVLSDNNFNFIALPAFIDYNSVDEMSALFKAEIFNQELIDAVSGPTFVCVYAGQTSNKLDLGDGSDFPNDGFDFKCKDGQLDVAGLPKDFTKGKEAHEHNVVAFAVNYGHQNQNIFTDIKLDQQEFSETDESLRITDTISQNGAQSNRTQAGQNLWNVYQVRSYSTEITAMGNAMIQPMMYFQLNNIPMFHGAYMIIKASHKLTPNHMTTTFKGVRTRFIDTPLIDSNTIYMSMLGNIGGNGAGGGGTTTLDRAVGSGGGKSYRGQVPIIGTISENAGTNGNITNGTGHITTSAIPKVIGVQNHKLNNLKENLMVTEAIAPLEKMLEAWVAWMKVNGFSGDANGNYVSINSIFRDYAKQVQIKKDYGSAAATPGGSPHGWGIAIDVQYMVKNGANVPNTKNVPAYFDTTRNPAIKWIYDNAYVYGFMNPLGLRNQSGLEEHWHLEYHGTSARCLIASSPSIYGYTIDTSKPIDSSVKNPKDKNGVPAKYFDNDCNVVVIKKNKGDGTGEYSQTNEGSAIITIPSDDSLSPYDIVIVYGGINYATPKWMLDEVSGGAEVLLRTNIFLFVPYTNSWGATEKLIKKIEINNKLDNFSIIGFSAGGSAVQQNLNKKSWKFIGLIDPSTNSTFVDNAKFNSKTYMFYNNKNWGGKYAATGPLLIKLSKSINEKGGTSWKVEKKHDKLPRRFFERWRKKIN